MTLPLADLVSLLPGAVVLGEPTTPVHAVTSRSSDVGPGVLFVAIQGSRVDGHQFVADALRAGAAGVVVDRGVDSHAPVVRVRDTREALALLAARLAGDPSAHLKVLGVTGTNGKTTTTWLAEALIRAAGGDPLTLGTVSYRHGGWEIPATHTTPDALALAHLLRDRAEKGATHVVMEVSSHALDQRRVDGLHFDVAVFTNLSRDHLDYHGDMESYFDAKARLFRELLPRSGKAGARAVIHTGDPWGSRLAQEVEGAWTFGMDPVCDLHPRSLEMDIHGIRGRIHTPLGEVEIDSPLVGHHNALNLLGAIGGALALGVPLSAISPGIRHVQVPGRLERVSAPGEPSVFVDYAHSDDALRRVSAELRRLTPGRLITVFGAGGDRDRGKRPLMGQAAWEHSDLAVVTSDNPRSEEPEAIVAEILGGLPPGARRYDEGTEFKWRGEQGYLVRLDRRAAIGAALAGARPQDTVLIAGKGHETYQEIAGARYPFDDRQQARALLREGPP